jgi:hypothetical protein
VGGSRHLKIKAFRMTKELDENGYFVLDHHCTVTLLLSEITSVDLADFLQGQAIFFELNINREADEFCIDFSSSHGLGDSIRARMIRAEIIPETVGTP